MTKFYNEDWGALEYFISRRKTVFDRKLLSNLEFEILLGKLSLKEKADIYNAVHGGDDSACDSDEESENGEESGGG